MPAPGKPAAAAPAPALAFPATPIAQAATRRALQLDLRDVSDLPRGCTNRAAKGARVVSRGGMVDARRGRGAAHRGVRDLPATAAAATARAAAQPQAAARRALAPAAARAAARLAAAASAALAAAAVDPSPAPAPHHPPSAFVNSCAQKFSPDKRMRAVLRRRHAPHKTAPGVYFRPLDDPKLASVEQTKRRATPLPSTGAHFSAFVRSCAHETLT